MPVDSVCTDEVQVVLTAVDPDADDGFFERRILLTNIDPEITIGRSTKRDLQLTAKSHNACFDCPVMSRKHAKLQFWPFNRVIPDSSDEEDIISDAVEVVDSDEETSVGKMPWAGIPSLLPDRTAIRSTVDLTSDDPPASKAQGTPSDAFCSGEISSNVKPASETKPLRCVSESGNSHGNAGVAHTSLQPSQLSYDSHEERHAVSEDADSSKVCSTPKLSPQTQLVDYEKSTPSPGGATLDAMALSTICQPTVAAEEKHLEASAAPNFSIDFGATKTDFLAGTKADFFAAREHNRRAHISLAEAAELLPSSNGVAKDDESSLSESSRCPISDVLGPSKSWTCTTTAALLASGAAPDPNAEVASVDSGCVEDSFEYSSAFACEMSKITDVAAILEDEETLLMDGIETDPPQLLATETECRPRKRKSDQLSVRLLTEAETGSSQIRDKSSALAPAAGAGRPLKRLRRAAEALGYATLGGFAVVSVLIATAPEF
ncbi:hypothetical protein E4U39_006463 [Claviceps sp. Clav50 group G5]|nr:hypothetical protein E4U39_006463 [Claviceps sp. Clav50 group G5]